MCLAAPSVSAPAPTPVPAPPPPPQRDPNPPVIADNDRANASAKRTGTSIFRNDLSIPTSGGAGPVRAGLNIPR